VNGNVTVSEGLAGTYEGTGEWFDSSGKSSTQAFVEASYCLTGDEVEVFGSSTTRGRQ
jgi:hypothetical protein